MQSSKLYLFKRGSKYYIQYIDQDNKKRQVSTGCSLKTEAAQFLRNHEQKYTAVFNPKRLSDFIVEFSAYGKGIYSKSTYRSYCSALKNLRLFIGDISLSNLTVRITDRFKAHRAQSVSPGSVNVELRALKAMFQLAKRWSYVSDNPFGDVTLMRSKNNDPKFLSTEHYNILINAIKEPWLNSVVQFAIFTGMRIGEIANLRWDQVHLERKIIVITNTCHFETKNKRNRIVPISEPVYRTLESAAANKVSEFVFHNHGTKLCATYTSKKFKNYIRELDLDKDFVFHNLRSTFASWMLMNGVDIYIVSKLLGHSDVTVTARHYANVHNEYLFKKMNEMTAHHFLQITPSV